MIPPTTGVVVLYCANAEVAEVITFTHSNERHPDLSDRLSGMAYMDI